MKIIVAGDATHKREAAVALFIVFKSPLFCRMAIQ